MAKKIEHFYKYLVTIYVSSFQNCVLSLLAHLLTFGI